MTERQGDKVRDRPPDRESRARDECFDPREFLSDLESPSVTDPQPGEPEPWDESGGASPAPPPLGPSARRHRTKPARKRRRSHATLRRLNRRNVTRAAIVVVALLAGLELYKQVCIQVALAHASQGEYSEALESLDRAGFSLLRHDRARALEREARFHTGVEQALRAVEDQNWFLARQGLEQAVAMGNDFASFPGRLPLALEAWSRAMAQLARQGEHLKCREALEALSSLSFDDDGLTERVRGHRRDTAVALARGFGEQGSWTAAIEEIGRARKLGLSPAAESEFLEALHGQMLAAIGEALDEEDFHKAEGLTRLTRAHFGGRTPDQGFTIEKIRIDRALKSGEHLESDGQFDQALEAYDRALVLSHGSRDVFERVAGLRHRLEGFVKHKDQWVPVGDDVHGNEALELGRHARRWGRHRLHRGERPAQIEDAAFGAGPVGGVWSLQLESTPSGPVWVVRGEVFLRPGYGDQARGDVRVGALITDRDYRPLRGRIAEMPYLLRGSSRSFKIRLEPHDDQHSVSVGILGSERGY